MSLQTDIINPCTPRLLEAVAAPTFLRATLSGPHRLQKNSPLVRAVIRPIQLHNSPHLQISRFDARKDFTQNIRPEEAPAALADLLAIGFANVHITTAEEDIDLRLSKKYDLHIGRKKHPTAAAPPLQPHNRPKQLPLPERPGGSGDHLLQLMGIMTKDGKIRPTMRPKFTQINEFLKLLDPLLDQLQLQPPSPGIAIPGPTSALKILDAGSGSAYLTLALHHYLNHTKKIPAHILGIDVNDDLIEKSIGRAHQLGHGQSEIGNSLHFQNSPIAAAENLHPDIVLALHACDTATDDAIALAIHAHAKILLAVPCCHKNLNAELHIPALSPLHRHGILHQRFADLLTDSFRGLILRIMGYKTDVIEFIAPEHTARNLMIRALKSTAPGNPNFIREYHDLKNFAAATPYLESAVGPPFTSLLQ